MASITRVPTDRQDCHHAKAPFDALFSAIGERADIGPGPKLLYGKLVSMHRIGAAWTQTEIGEMLGTCRQNIWRWTNDLVAAGLLLVVRLGQGRPNQYTLLGVPQEDLDGKAPRFKAPGSGHQDGRRPGADRADSYRKKENRGRMPGYTPHGCDICGQPKGQPHLQGACFTRDMPPRR